MRTASAIIGIIGGIWAFGWSMVGLVFGRDGSGFYVFYLMLVFLAIVGILGGILALKRPAISITLLFLSSVGLIISLVKVWGLGEEGWDYLPAVIGYIVGSPIMIIGAIIGIISALKSKNKRENT